MVWFPIYHQFKTGCLISECHIEEIFLGAGGVQSGFFHDSASDGVCEDTFIARYQITDGLSL